MGQLGVNVSQYKSGKTYVYRMLLSFKPLVTYKKQKLISRRTTVSDMKQLSSDITRYFVGH